MSDEVREEHNCSECEAREFCPLPENTFRNKEAETVGKDIPHSMPDLMKDFTFEQKVAIVRMISEQVKKASVMFALKENLNGKGRMLVTKSGVALAGAITTELEDAFGLSLKELDGKIVELDDGDKVAFVHVSTVKERSKGRSPLAEILSKVLRDVADDLEKAKAQKE